VDRKFSIRPLTVRCASNQTCTVTRRKVAGISVLSGAAVLAGKKFLQLLAQLVLPAVLAGGFNAFMVGP
jgi:hypothetical protein